MPFFRKSLILTLLGSLTLVATAPALTYKQSRENPPMPEREFRGAWVASVWNIDWPSRPGLSASQQRAEMDRLLDLAADLKLNAIVLQVRPEADALYKSRYEPWSYWLSGQMGKGTSDGYDPLEYAVEQAHYRGMELHAWFNPFRGRATTSKPASSDHVSRKNPQMMLPGNDTWMNPALKSVQDRALDVITDVVKRYDIDGVHLDDYFYPYPKVVSGKAQFPYDDSSHYAAYRKSGGKLSIEDWRRSLVDGFVSELATRVKQTKPWVKFGISPFGIWRPGVPSSIEAQLDSYDHLFADSRRWLQEGWVDYLSPQLYWRIDPKAQSFSTLSNWWSDQNSKGRHVWPGIASSRIKSDEDRSRPSQESIRQIDVTRATASNKQGSGHIHWSFSALEDDRDGIRAKLKGSYQEVALIPESPWMSRTRPPSKPLAEIKPNGQMTRIKWAVPTRNQDVRWWVVQGKESDRDNWQTIRVLSAKASGLDFRQAPAGVAVRAVNSYGQISEPVVLTLSK